MGIALSIQAQAHTGPLPPPDQLAAYEAASPGAAKWILDQAAMNSRHVRTVELQAIAIQRRDQFLHRVFPFGVVLAFLISSTMIAIFASVAVGAAGLAGTMGAVMIAYLKGSVPPANPK